MSTSARPFIILGKHNAEFTSFIREQVIKKIVHEQDRLFTAQLTANARNANILQQRITILEKFEREVRAMLTVAEIQIYNGEVFTQEDRRNYLVDIEFYLKGALLYNPAINSHRFCSQNLATIICNLLLAVSMLFLALASAGIAGILFYEIHRAYNHGHFFVRKQTKSREVLSEVLRQVDRQMHL